MATFIDTEHQARFLAGMVALGYRTWEQLPNDWAACLFTLTAHHEIWADVSPHVNLTAHEISWNKIRRLDLGRGREFLVHLAQYLYNETGKLEWDSLWSTLDHKNFALAMAAIEIRRDGGISIRLAKGA